MVVDAIESLFLHVPSSLGATALFNVQPGTGGIFLDNLGCTGTESRLIDCPHNGLNVHNCLHFEDAGVACLESLTRRF